MARLNAASRARAGENKRNRTRAGLMEAARRVLATKGPDAPTIDDFISEAGVAKGTFYNYFESRELIVKAVLDEVMDDLKSEITAVLREVDDPTNRISTMIRYTIRRASNDPVWGWFMVRMFPAGPSRDAMHKEFVADLKRGLLLSHFQFESVSAALDLIRGSTVMGMRTMVRELAPPNHAERVAIMVLRGLGVSSQQAAKAIRRVLELPPSGDPKAATVVPLRTG